MRMKKRLFYSTAMAVMLAFGLQFGTDAVAQTAPDTNWPADESLIPGKGNNRTNAWFKQHYKGRRDYFWKNFEASKNSVVFLGDSITENWERRLANDFPEFKVCDRGISGDVTRMLLYRLQEDVLDLNPRAVTLLIGTNDLDEGNTPENIAANTIEILEKLKAARPDMPVLIANIMPRSKEPDFRTSFIIIANRIVADYVKKANNPNWYMVDYYSALATPKGVVDHKDMNDFLHPTDQGYEKCIKVIKPLLHQLNLEKYEKFFNGKDLTGWEVINGGDWTVENGELVGRNGKDWTTDPSKSGSWLCFSKAYYDFELKLQYSINEGGNSGIFFHSGKSENPSYNGYEMQITSSVGAAPTKQGVCSLYDLEAPLMNPVKKSGEWNDVTITAKGEQITIYVNGQKTIDVKNNRRSYGFIGLQNHDSKSVVKFRNITIEELK